MTNEAFAAMLGAKITFEQAYWTAGGGEWFAGQGSWFMSLLPDAYLDLYQSAKGGEISWGMMNNPANLGGEVLNWWDGGGYAAIGKSTFDFISSARGYGTGWQGTPEARTEILIHELETEPLAIEHMAAAMMFSAYEATTLNSGQQEIVLEDQGEEMMCVVIYPRPMKEISAHIIASGVINHGDALGAGYHLVYDFNLKARRGQGSSDNWVTAIPYAAKVLGLSVGDGDYLDYTPYEKRGLGMELNYTPAPY